MFGSLEGKAMGFTAMWGVKGHDNVVGLY